MNAKLNFYSFALLFFIIGVKCAFAQEITNVFLTDTDRNPLSKACPNTVNNFNNFDFSITLNGNFGGPNDDNIFVLELSDAEGSFENAVELIKTIPSSSFNNVGYQTTTLLASQLFGNATIPLPADVAGQGYRVRVRATAVDVTSEPSPSFEAYFYDGTTIGVFRNNEIKSGNLMGVQSICASDGGTNTVTLTALPYDNSDPNNPTAVDPSKVVSYIWYRSADRLGPFSAIPGENTSNIIVSDQAFYKAAIDLGSCTANFPGTNGVESNTVGIIVEGEGTAEVVNQFNEVVSSTPNPINVCQNDELRLIPNPNLTTSTYKWFRDGNLLDTGGSAIAVVGDGGAIPIISGVYRLEVISGGGCASSVEVTVTIKNPEIKIDKPDVVVVDQGGSITLNAITNSPGSLQWFKGDNAIPNANGTSYVVDSKEIDDYKVRLSATSECGSQTFSQTVTIFLADSYAITIGFQDPALQGCEIESRTLVIEDVVATGMDKNSQTVTETLAPEAYQSLGLNWQLAGTDIGVNADGLTYVVNDLNQVGLYTLRIGTSISNQLDVNLRVSINELTASSEFLCFDSSITIFGFGDSYTYRWFFNGAVIDGETGGEIRVSEPGIYQAEVTSASCGTNLTDELTVELFGEGAISVDPGFSVNMGQRESLVMTASGGESYEWFKITKDDNDTITSEELLSIEDNLEIFSSIFEEGQVIFYQLRSQVGGCVVANEIAVRRELSNVIPNLITVNGDNINDRWVIPSEFVDKDEVTITIFDTYGKEDFRTTNYQNNWPEEDSNSSGKNAVYYYIIENESNGQTEKGSITVMR